MLVPRGLSNRRLPHEHTSVTKPPTYEHPQLGMSAAQQKPMPSGEGRAARTRARSISASQIGASIAVSSAASRSDPVTEEEHPKIASKAHVGPNALRIRD